DYEVVGMVLEGENIARSLIWWRRFREWRQSFLDSNVTSYWPTAAGPAQCDYCSTVRDFVVAESGKYREELYSSSPFGSYFQVPGNAVSHQNNVLLLWDLQDNSLQPVSSWGKDERMLIRVGGREKEKESMFWLVRIERVEGNGGGRALSRGERGREGDNDIYPESRTVQISSIAFKHCSGRIYLDNQKVVTH
ncbi:hypothetical protein KSS87_013940, partial [Heliosperma pusillum]